MKIAVPVEGENLKIVQRTGEAPYFAIFNDAEFERIVEAPGNSHSHDGHGAHHGHGHDHHHDHEEEDHAHINRHGKSLVNLGGCEVMLIRMIGEHMREAVERAGMKIKKSREKEGEYAPDAINAYLDKKSTAA
jgi:predicted Fe-Mo cluster-binding NifX family protein